MPATWDAFGPLLPGVSHIPYNNVDALQEVSPRRLPVCSWKWSRGEEV